jgi:peptide/nickel transport system permease protein
MIAFLLRRILASGVLLFFVLTATFLLVQLAPGSPADRYMDPRLPRQQSEHLAELYGFDRPPFEQYLSWLGAVLAGEWGFSFGHLRPVTEVLAEFFPRTLLLAAAALVLQYAFGIGLGVLAARRPGGAVDHVVRLGAMAMFAIPVYWLGLMLVLLFSHTWHLLPSGHMASLDAASLSPTERLLDLLRHLLLPAVVLAAPMAAETARFVRNGLLDVLGQEYIRAARARGLSEPRILLVHALRNAVIAVTQITGLEIAFLLGGSFTVEWVFAWPGLGFMTLQAIDNNDYPLILATTALTGSLVIAGNFLADLLHAAVDPRVREA